MHPRLELLHQAPATTAARLAPPLLFVHGAFCGAWCWRENFMPWFARQGYDCWALSLEGHGGSEGRDYLAAIGVDDYVRNLDATLKQLPAAPVMVGHSMGGFVAQQYLSRHKLPGAALLASVPPGGLASSSLRLLTQAPALFLKLNMYQHGLYDPEFVELKDMLLSPDAPESAVELLISRCQQESQRALMDMTLVNPLANRPLAKMPALVLGAAEDKLVGPEDVVATARRLDVAADILPHLSHMMMLDTRWESAAEWLASWLERQFPEDWNQALSA